MKNYSKRGERKKLFSPQQIKFRFSRFHNFPFYSHVTKTAGWLPPAENWGPGIDLPYGWEKAVTTPSGNGQFYYIK